MHAHAIVMGLAVCWACLGGLWRPGSLALAMGWVIGEAVARASGNGLPIDLYRIVDLPVALIIFRLRSSWLDWSILGCFAVQWGLYQMDYGATQWWWLWVVTLAQMVLAGPWPGTQVGRAWYSHGRLRTGTVHEV